MEEKYEINMAIFMRMYTEKYKLLKTISEKIDAKVTRLGNNTDIEGVIADLEEDLNKFNILFEEIKSYALSKLKGVEPSQTLI